MKKHIEELRELKKDGVMVRTTDYFIYYNPFTDSFLLDVPEEKKMVSIYSNILDLNGNEIGIKNNFFTIGGDSLRAVLLCIEINKAFGVQIAPADIFKYPTIEEQIELDRIYIREQSVFVDVKIIMKTMLLVVKRKNE